jgi:hypothetical protein
MGTKWMNEVKGLAAQERERNAHARPYAGLAYMDNPTSKQEGSPIIGTDTIKGCRNNCFRCYANRISRFHRKVFIKPVKCFVLGSPDPEIVYRFGTFGDPATDWHWTFHELDRLRGKGMHRFYLVTKLQNVEGFRDDPSLCVHVSFDLLNPHQLARTMRNFDAVGAKSVIRLKSIRSGHRALMARQAEAIEFAGERNVPILETRFYTNVKGDLRLLRMEGYKKKGTLFKYPGSVLQDCFALEGHRTCDRRNTGKCRDCLNCLAYLN